MAGDRSLVFEQLPRVAPYYLRAATTLSGGLSQGQTIPEIEARIDGLRLRSEHLARYRKVCGFPRDVHLPLTYPHVLAFPLHMAVLTHSDFPLKLLGLVHIRNEITQNRPISVDEALDLRIRVDGHRETAKGIEFDLLTDASIAGEKVWQASGTMLSRQKTSIPRKDSGQRPPPTLGFTPDEESPWSLPGDLGRRYAAAAGDYNPIHLSPISAKLFGFKRAIAHGMWVKARATAALSDRIGNERACVSVAFKKPVFLPGEAVFKTAAPSAGQNESRASAFALTDRSGEIHHVTGTLTSG